MAHDQQSEAAILPEKHALTTSNDQPAALQSDTDKHDETVNMDHIQENIRKRVSTPIWIIIVATILSATFLFSLDNTIVAEVQAVVIDDLGEANKLSWLAVAFVLASSSTIVTWGKLYGVFSVKWTYIVSIILFEIGSALCGAAPTMNAMIVGRAIAGFGGSGMYLGCITLLTLTTSLRERPNYMAVIGITWGLGTVLGPVVGGAFSESSATWRWAFYINLCIGAAFAPVYLFYLPTADPQPSLGLNKKLTQLDYAGIILNVGAFTALVMALSFGGTVYDWSDGREIALWVVGGVLLLLFCVQQGVPFLTTVEKRIFPADFLRMKIMWLLYILMSSAATCVFVPTFYIPLYFQFIRGDEPLTAAVRLLPFICIMVFFGLLNGALMAKFGYYMPWYFFGGVFATVGGALMYTVDASTSNSKVYGYIVLIGIGAGMYIQTSFSVAQAKVPHHRSSDAGSYIALAQNFGIVMALAISGAVFQNTVVKDLRQLLPQVPEYQVKQAISGAGSELFAKASPDMAHQMLEIIVDSIAKIYILVITAGALAVVGSLFMSRERLFLQGGAVGG